jgi:hypothetical protein
MISGEHPAVQLPPFCLAALLNDPENQPQAGENFDEHLNLF